MSEDRGDAARLAKPRGRLFQKYVVIFASLVSGALLASGALDIYFSYQEHKQALAAIQREKAIGAATRIEQFVRQIERLLESTTYPMLVTGMAAVEQRRMDFARLQRQVLAITNVSWLDRAGREQLRVSRLALEAVGSGLDQSQDPKFVQTQSGKTYFSPISFRKESEPYLTIAVAGPGASGVSVADVNLKFIGEVVSQIQVGQAGHAYVVDGTGQLIAHPDISLVLTRTDLSDLASVKAARASGGVARPGEEAIIARDLHGRRVLTAFAPVVPLGWFVLVELPLAEAFAPIRASILRTALVVLFGVGLAVVVSLLLARRMTHPIQALQAGAAQIGTGDLAHRIDVRTGDEVEALAEAFNRMAEALQARIEELKRAQDEALRKTRLAALGEIAAVVAHETRNPLGAISNCMQILGKHVQLSPDDAELLDIIKSETARLNMIVSDFLAYGHPRPPIFQTVDLHESIDDALSLLRRDDRCAPSIVVGRDFEPSSPSVHADPGQLRQVFWNLLLNAVQAMGSTGTLTVETRTRDGRVEIAISDTGPGISPADLPRLFEPFQTRRTGGMGLGLATVRRIVEDHGGHVSAESAVGTGTRILISLPHGE